MNNIYLNYGVIFNRNNFGIFDLDWCIIKTKSGKKFPIDYNDWDFLYENIPAKLRELSKSKIIMIISNQMGISEGKVNKENFVKKINNIQKKLNIPMIFCASIYDDNFRKPRTGFIDHIKKLSIYGENAIFKDDSFFVGDMAGRIKTKKHKADRNDTDRKFALNLGINFYTPEQFFMNNDPREYELKGYQLNYTKNDNLLNLPKLNDSKIMILLTGYPGSGKSTLAKNIKDYLLLSKDIYKNKMKKELINNLKIGKNVIIEGLLYNLEKREPYLKLAKEYNYKIIFINLLTDFDLSYHLNVYRSLNDNVKKVTKVVYYTYRKYYEEPIKKNYIKVINYHPNISSDVNKKYLY